MTNTKNETKLTVFYILIAYIFSVLLRMIWVYQFAGYEPFLFNGEFMLNTNDGYFFAEGARDILSGVSQANDLSPVDRSVSKLTAFFVSILPFSFETVIFYLPVFLSSLVVIPMILIAKEIENLEMGLIAALLSSIAWSYYNRTMAGYFDTDMLNIVLPMFVLWSIIVAIKTQKNIYLLFTAFTILAYSWWYVKSYSLVFSFFGLMLLYTLVFDRKNSFNYKLLTLMLLSMMGFDAYMKTILVLGVFYLFTQEKFDKYIYYIFGISITAFFITGGFTPIWAKLSVYIFSDSVSTSSEGLQLHFFTVAQTIREAGQIPFTTFANRISGHTITFVLSLAGYVYLAYKHKIMLLALPMIGLGFLASVGGLRFTIYAVPILAFGIAFLITELASTLPTKKMRFLSMVAFTLAILYPNYKHIDAYRVPTVFNATEVKILDKLKTIADREDYVIGWWDYGYPLRYFSDVKTLTDGGKHEGDVNFPVSFILTSPQEEAARMARLDVEYTEKGFDSNVTSSNIEQMTKDYGFKDTNDFLYSLKTDINLSKKTRDIYFYLPFKMLSILPTVKLFSNMDLMSGEKKKDSFLFVSRNFKSTPERVILGNGVSIDNRKGTIILGKQEIPIKRFVKTAYDKSMKLHVDVKLLNFSSGLNVIYMSNYSTFIILDDAMYNSTYIQLMVLEKYDKNLFEEVILDPNVKIYKLKI